VASRGGAVAGVLDELLLRDELWSGARKQLVALRARLGDAPVLPRGAARVWASADGAAIVAMRRGRRGRARRTLVVLLDAGGALARVLYDAGGSAAFSLPALRARLAAEGHALRRAEVRAVSARIAEAARRACAGGERLPRGYHLGRDLVGLDDEHAAPPAPSAAPQLLERGTAQLEAGDPAAARPLLGAFVAVHPEDAEARTWLACALMALQQPAAALPHLRAAARLEPEDPVRWWNLAAAARQADKHGASYLALGDFLRRASARRSPARRRAALRYRRLYERMVGREHPGVRARDMARGEELFDRACDALDAGRAAEAVRGFEAVLELVPSHHPSWSNLGAAYTQLDRRGDARRCLERALTCRPGYDVAERNLRTLDRT
jgi:tetratricopeptide (TPR) repeat protein